MLDLSSFAGFNSLVGGVMGFSILLSAEVFKHNARVWYLDGSIGVLIGLTIFAYGVKYGSVFISDPPSSSHPFLQPGQERRVSCLIPLCLRNMGAVFAFPGEM